MRMMKKAAMAATALASFAAVPANAADFSFAGSFLQDDNVAFFDFTASGASVVTLRSYSYAGGTNAAGTIIAAGGFDPVLTLFNLTTGSAIAFQDDGSGVPTDPVTRAGFDVNFVADLAAGNYRVALSQFDNFGGATVATPFSRAGQGNFTSAFCRGGPTGPFCDATGAKRSGNWAFDVRGVSVAATPAVPEPATWAMMILGMGAIGATMRRRSRVRTTVAFG